MNYPAPLYYGDTVALIAPCSPVKKNKLSDCIDAICSMGFHVITGESATASLHGYLSGCDELRARDINQMFANPEVKAIFCIRGGYGSNRIMHLLDYDMIRQNPKIFVGYSDITSFHLALHSLCDLVTFHGPMVSANMLRDFDSYTKESFYNAISMPNVLPFANPNGMPYDTIVSGTASGRIIGGCLSLVSPSIGTFYEPDFEGKILFLEDVEEYLPRCDKLMCHLQNSGILDKINGVVLGNFIDCTNPKDEDYMMQDFFLDFFSGYDKPVICNIQSGHDKPMGTIPFGTYCTLDTENNSLSFEYI